MKKLFIIITIAVFIFLTIFILKREKTEVIEICNNENINIYLMKNGWNTDISKIESKKITIPYVFSDIYTDYNNIQKLQGFDLEKYKGTQAELIICPILNYADREDVCAQLIVQDSHLIGANLVSYGENGFIRPINIHK